MRKNLPRPYKPRRHLMDSYLSFVPEEAGLRKEAEQLLSEEMLRMVTRDAALYPFKGSFPGEDVPDYETFDEKELLEADKLLKQEMTAIKLNLGHGDLSSEAMLSVWEENKKNLVYDDDSQLFIDGKNLPKEEKIAYAKNEFLAKKAKLVI